MFRQTYHRYTIPAKSRQQIAFEAKEEERNKVIRAERRVNLQITDALRNADYTLLGCRKEIAKVIKLVGP